MTLGVREIFLIFALVSFLIAAFKATLLPAARVDFTALGFALVVAAFLFG